MKTVWLWSAALLLLLVTAGAPVAQQATHYEHPGELKPAQVLPAALVRGPHYQVQNPVVADGYMLRFNVRSDYGPFEVIGTSALRKLVVEIGAIAELREIKTGQAFRAAVADSARGPFRFAKNLITHPADTVTGVPKGAYRLFEDVGETATTERNPSDDPAYQKVLLVSGRKREYAAKLGVDVYSSNPVLQKELNSVGWAAAVGNLTVSAALMPVGGAAGAAISGVRWSNAFNDYVNVEPASRLRIIASDTLKEIGVPGDVINSFIDQPQFTPRQHVVIAVALSQLGPAPARGRTEFLQVAFLATDGVEASFFTSAAQVLRGYHKDVAAISEIHMNKRIAVAKSTNGSLVLALPVDHLMWTQGVDRRSQELVGSNRAAGFTGKVEAWLTGIATPLARQHLADRGIVVVENVNRRMEIVD